MILANGALLSDRELGHVLERLEREVTDTLSGPSLKPETVISALERLGSELDSGSLDPLIARYAPPGTREELARVRPQLSRTALEARLSLELDRLSGPRPFGHSELRPLGVLLHIAPGNMAGLPAFTTLEGLLTGNLNLVKLPREDRGLTLAVLHKLTGLEPRLTPWLYAFDLPSSNREALEKLASLSGGIVVWGGDGAVRAVREMAPPGCRLIEWGHRLSFAYLSGPPDEAELAGLARHIVHTNGLLCSSCQVIFLDTGELSGGAAFCKRFLPVLEQARREESGTLGQGAQATLYAREAWLEHIVDRQGRGEEFFPGHGCSLTLCRDRELELSPLHGNVLVKCLPRAELVCALRPQRGRLQTAGLLCPPSERAELAALLARAGVNRITYPGHMSRTFPGEAHDGAYPLGRYMRVVDIEEMRNSG